MLGLLINNSPYMRILESPDLNRDKETYTERDISDQKLKQ